MTGLVRRIAAVAACYLAAAGIAMAGVPDVTNFECLNVGAQQLGLNCLYSSIYVVGDDAAGAADPFGEFCLYARDFNNAPIPNVTVVIDFSGCDLQLCANPLDPDAIVDCVSMTVRKVANAQGVACFRVRGKSRWPQPDCSAPAANCAVVFADGVFICSLDAPTFDLVSQSGEDGLNPNDIAEWLRLAFNCPEGPYRGNYDCTNRGVLDPNDLAVFLRVHFAGGSASNCTGAKCP